MNQYRKLDDTINMRLNRTTAQYRDREREGLGGKGDVEEQACAHVWKELVGTFASTIAVTRMCTDILTANWSRRTDIVHYCVGVVDSSLDEKRQILQDAGDDASAQRKAKGILYAEEVKVRYLGFD